MLHQFTTKLDQKEACPKNCCFDITTAIENGKIDNLTDNRQPFSKNLL